MLWPGRKALRAILGEAEAQGTDRVIFGTPWPLALLGPRLAAEGLRYAVIVHGAELVVPAAVPVLRGRLARALASAELLLPVSGYTADKIAGTLQRAKLAQPLTAVLRARVDTERFRPEVDTTKIRAELGLGANDKMLLCFGRLVPRKGVDRAIALAHGLGKDGPTLVIAGTGPEEKKLRSLAAEGPGHVVFAGRVPDEDAPAVYAAADAFLLPVADRWFGLEIEGLGVVLCEAAAAGAACVTGRSGGTPEAVLDGETGYVVDATKPEELEGRVRHLLDHPDEAERMGAHGRAYVEREFSGTIPTELEEWLSGL